MQIRERKSTWALIRTTYDKTRKRGVARCLGTVRKSADEVSPDLAAKLTPAELEQIAGLVRTQRQARERERAEHYGRVLPRAIRCATAWYLDPRCEGRYTAALAAETRDAFSELLAAMVKSGVGRRRRRASR